MNDSLLEEAVVRTLAFFSLFHFPLTAEELFVYLWRAPAREYPAFRQWLEGYHGTHFGHDGAFYLLPGREADVVARRDAVVFTEQKIRRALYGMQFIRWIPFLEAVFVCNSVAAGTASKRSDIDLFIVTSDGRTWLVRFLTNLVLRLARLRLYGTHVENRLCLSFYSDRRHLDMRAVALGPDDVYLAYWLVQLLPAYDPHDVHSEIISRNTWMHELVPNAMLKTVERRERTDTLFEKVLRGRVGDWLESVAKKIQLRHITKKSAGKPRSAVVIEDGFLKFHETDRREEFRTQWKNLCS